MVKDVYLLVMHDPYEEPGVPQPINGVIVHALSLLHPDLPQPDAGRIYRCLTEFPGRTPGCLVPLSTLNYELDNGRLWPEITDEWVSVIARLITLTRPPVRCDSMPIAFPEPDATLLAAGPFASVPARFGIPDRNELLAMLTADLPGPGDVPLWPGDDLVAPPKDPVTMPYLPHGT